MDDGGAQQEQSEPLRERHGHIASRGGLKPPDPHLRKHVRSGAVPVRWFVFFGTLVRTSWTWSDLVPGGVIPDRERGGVVVMSPGGLSGSAFTPCSLSCKGAAARLGSCALPHLTEPQYEMTAATPRG